MRAVTLALAAGVAGAETSLGDPALDFLVDLGSSTGLGILFGLVLALLVFVVLGANLPFGEIRREALPAIAVVASLIFVARPLVVAASLLLDRRARWTREEVILIAWTRETGIVPAALAGLLVARGVPHAELVVVVVALRRSRRCSSSPRPSPGSRGG
ncbi:MAG: hypothetical protein ICV67_06165 [Thermoleophilia bacterium]|nr:hypothetical protein [Thermoleophilia bacterium]